MNLEKISCLRNKRLTAIIEYIRTHIGVDLSDKKPAVVSFLSEDYIDRIFKNLTSQNIQDFVENHRLEMAGNMLNTTLDSISEITFSAGF